MNPNNPLSLTSCWLCQAPLFLADASNFAGHYAHGSCIAKWNATKAAGVTPESVPPPEQPAPEITPPPVEEPPVHRPVPRMWEDTPLARCPALGVLGQQCDKPAGHPGDHHMIMPEVPVPEGVPSPLPDMIMGMDPAFGPDSSVVMVAFTFPSELVMDGPNASDILSECRNVAEMLLGKNRAYGSSFAEPLNIFSKLDPVAAIDARLDDKLARIKQSKDFTEDTEQDIIGYLILKRIAMRLAREKRDRETQPELPGLFQQLMAQEAGLVKDLLRESLANPTSYAGARIPDGPKGPCGPECPGAVGQPGVPGVAGHRDEPGPPCPPGHLPNGQPCIHNQVNPATGDCLACGLNVSPPNPPVISPPPPPASPVPPV